MRRRIVFVLFAGFWCAGMVARVGLGQANPPNPADTATPQWEIDAGGKMAFDVASVKRVMPDSRSRVPTFPLDSSDAYASSTTLLSADSPLTIFIGFAYKLSPIQQRDVSSQLPKWATTDRFALDARAAAPSTKDQMRLMMQSLLAERFKLAIHFEMQEKPVFALVLVKAGKVGPQLHAYADDPPCSNSAPSGPNTAGLKTTVGEFPPMCYVLMGFSRPVNGTPLITWGSRNVSMRQIAVDMETAPTANIDRTVIDHTGMSGNFDFLMTFGVPTPAAPGTEPKDSGPTFLEALKDQLGLKLDSATAAVEIPVIDNIEEPSAN